MPVNHKDDSDRTPLMCAVQHPASRGAPLHTVVTDLGSLRIVLGTSTATLLLDRGTEVGAADSKWMTALHYAAQAGSAQVVTLLLDRGADGNARTKKKHGRTTALHLASEWYREYVVPVLLSRSRGGNKDAVDARGCTPLHWACVSGSPSVATQLLNRGARADVRDKEGATPLHLLCGSPSHVLMAGWSLVGQQLPPDHSLEVVDPGGRDSAVGHVPNRHRDAHGDLPPQRPRAS